MRRRAWIGALLLTLMAGGRGFGGEPPGCAPGRPCFLQRVGPAGGWFPYGGGLLRWWDPHCFPRGGGPDDYDRKPLPPVCWPPCPPTGCQERLPAAAGVAVPDGRDRVGPR